MQERSIRASGVPWESPPGYPDGLKRKILRTAPDGRPRVALIRLEAGFEAETRRHDAAENHYVLEGMYESRGKEYPAGAYRYLPKNVEQGTVRSRGGALILVTWEP
jgi:anti-sigma factor ChrR (cupin superfamily)